MTYFIGCDVGTTATKAGVFDTEGKLLASARRESKLHYGKDGSVIQDPYEMLESVTGSVKEAVEKSGVSPSDIGALALDGQMAGIMGVNGEGEPATPYDSWLDIRSAPYAEKMKKEGGDLVVSRSGMDPSINHGPKILWWKYEHPDVYRNIARFTMPSCWILQKMAGLAGEETFIDYTYLHFSCFSDLKKRTWDRELLTLFALEEAKFPRIVDPWAVVGKMERQWADACGLLQGTPLVAGCGDQAANVMGAGVVEEGTAFDIAGTASCFCLNVKDYAPDVEYKTLLFPRSVLPEFFYPMAYINGGGMDLEWAKNELFKDVAHQPDVFSIITREVEKKASVPAGLVFIPHLRGRNCPTQPYMRGVWAGFSWDHSREHLFRAILEGIAFEYAFYLGIIKELMPEAPVENVRVIGGGAKSSFWNTIKASVLGVPYYELNREECAIWGAALVAGHAVGSFPDLPGHSARSTRVTRSHQPVLELSKVYDEMFPFYLETMKKMGDVFTIHSHLLQEEE